MATSHSTEPLVLIGMMGSGKSTVGVALAAALGRRYVDNDELVEQATGRTARELLADGGTPAVRIAEAAALRHGLAGPPATVLGVAAGTVLDPELRELLRTARVVWLRARPATLARRVLAGDHGAEGRHRPWHDDTITPEDWLAREDVRRRPLYESIADVAVDVDDAAGEDRPVDQLAREIVGRLGGGA